MEEIKLYCRGKICGEVTMREEQGRTEIRCTMDDPRDGLYRAVLVGELGKLMLGVLEPQNGRLTLCRRPYTRDVAQLGTLLRIEVSCSFPFRRRSAWEMVEHPARLFQDAFLRRRLEPVSHAWRRRRGDGVVLAIPLREREPFPLVSLFCLARVERVEGERCVVYRFDSTERPLTEPYINPQSVENL
ncbi:MAG: hypothetical protein IKC03_02405 [Oscillospiraceae bacterium]|nr:hypothetical protein [Oscillospiraceae bacterium]